jgi:hypothetical protein
LPCFGEQSAPVIRDGNEIVLNHLARSTLPHAISQAISADFA